MIRGAPVDSAQGFFPTVPVPRRMMHTYTGTFLLMFIAIFSCGAAYITCPNSNGKSEKGTCGTVKMIQKIQQYMSFLVLFDWYVLRFETCAYERTQDNYVHISICRL